MTATATAPARPFVKWVGGKHTILPLLPERVPPAFSRYVEPFVGGGAGPADTTSSSDTGLSSSTTASDGIVVREV